MNRFNVLAVICSCERGNLESAINNALQLCELFNRTDIKVFRGKNGPLNAEYLEDNSVSFVQPEPNPWNELLPEPQMKPTNSDYAEFIISSIKLETDPVTLISASVLTDIYLTLKRILSNNLRDRISAISIKGGVVDERKHAKTPQSAEHPWSESNVSYDPKASKKFFKLCESNNLNIFLTPLDITQTLFCDAITLSRLQKANTPQIALITKLLLRRSPGSVECLPHDTTLVSVYDLHSSMSLLHPMLYLTSLSNLKCTDRNSSTPGKLSFFYNRSNSNIFILDLPHDRNKSFLDCFVSDIIPIPQLMHNTHSPNISEPNQTISLIQKLLDTFQIQKDLILRFTATISSLHIILNTYLKAVETNLQSCLDTLSSPHPENNQYIFLKLSTIIKSTQSFLQTELRNLDFDDTNDKSIVNDAFTAILRNAQDLLRHLPPLSSPRNRSDSSQNQALRKQQLKLFDTQKSPPTPLATDFIKVMREIKITAMQTNWKFPDVFISYAWPTESNNHEEWVQPFLMEYCRHLELAGIVTHLDLKDSSYGYPAHQHMNDMSNCSHVIVIGTQSLYEKDKDGASMVCTELNIARKARRDKTGPRVVPILLSGEFDESFPPDFIRYTAIESLLKTTYLSHLKDLIRFLFLDTSESAVYEKVWLKFKQIYADEFTHSSPSNSSSNLKAKSKPSTEFFASPTYDLPRSSPHSTSYNPEPNTGHLNEERKQQVPPSSTPQPALPPGTMIGGIVFNNTGNVSIGSQSSHMHYQNK